MKIEDKTIEQAWELARIHVDCAVIALKRGNSGEVREVATSHLKDALKALRSTEPDWTVPSSIRTA